MSDAAGPPDPGAAAPGSATPGSAAAGPAVPDPAAPGPTTPGPAAPDPGPGPATPDPAAPGSAAPGPAVPDPAVPDPATLAALHASAFTLPRPWSAAEFAALLASPRHRVLSDPSGLAVISIVADEAELLTIATAPGARRQGHGRRLLARALAAAAGLGARAVFLEVAADNTPALALYESAGFRACGRRRAYYRGEAGAVDAVLMTRALAPRHGAG